jgi:hypothetical protein
VNYVAGQTVPNLVIAKLGLGSAGQRPIVGVVCFYSMAATDLVADVSGYFPAGSDYSPVTNPRRILDTRNGTGVTATIGPGSTLSGG